jgi:DNA-binding IclR family transcriptional regulator
MKELKNSVHKTFALLEYFTSQKLEWGVTELAKEVGSNKSTVFRFLAQMHSIGILDKNEEVDKYRLGLKLFELGNRVKLRSAFVEKIHDDLLTVAQNIAETVHIAVLKNNQVLYIDKVESPQGLTINSHIGSTLPAHATGLGKVLLASLIKEKQNQALDYIFNEVGVSSLTENTITSKRKLKIELGKISKDQFAIDREEFEKGLICVAIPIHNINGEVVAALSASGPAARFEEKEVKNYVSTLREGAEAMKQKIGNFKII